MESTDRTDMPQQSKAWTLVMNFLHWFQKTGLTERKQVLITLPLVYLPFFLFCLQLGVVPRPTERGLESIHGPPIAALLEVSAKQWEVTKLAPDSQGLFIFPNVALEMLFLTGISSKPCSRKIPSPLTAMCGGLGWLCKHLTEPPEFQSQWAALNAKVVTMDNFICIVSWYWRSGSVPLLTSDQTETKFQTSPEALPLH